MLVGGSLDAHQRGDRNLARERCGPGNRVGEGWHDVTLSGLWDRDVVCPDRASRDALHCFYRLLLQDIPHGGLQTADGILEFALNEAGIAVSPRLRIAGALPCDGKRGTCHPLNV